MGWSDAAPKPNYLADKSKPYDSSQTAAFGHYKQPIKCKLSLLPGCLSIQRDTDVKLPQFDCPSTDPTAEEYKKCVREYWEKNYDAIEEDIRVKTIAAKAQMFSGIKSSIANNTILGLVKVKWQASWQAAQKTLKFRPIVEHLYPLSIDSSILASGDGTVEYGEDADDDDENNGEMVCMQQQQSRNNKRESEYTNAASTKKMRAGKRG